MKTKFKVGDNVRFVRDVVCGELFKACDTGTIKEIRHDFYLVQQDKPYRCEKGLWWVLEDALCLADNDLTHDQFKSPLDGSWRHIMKYFGGKWTAVATDSAGNEFEVTRKTKRGLLNTLHRMNIQTRKAK